MTCIIIKKEFLSRIFTFQFTFGIIISVFLISISTVVLTKNYQEKLRNFQQSVSEHANELRQIKVYSALNPKLELPPQPLSVFNEGVVEQFGNQVTIRRDEIPRLEAGSDVDNEFLVIFSNIDITTIIKIIMSLLAILFAYNCVTEDKEAGTLKQVLANPIPRYKILLSKYIGGISVLLLALTVSILFGLIIFLASARVAISGQIIARVLTFMVISAIYISIFYLIGMLISTLTSRSSTSLIFSLLCWVVFVILYPDVASYAVKQFYPLETPKAMERALKELTDNFKKFRIETEISLLERFHPPGFFLYKNKKVFATSGIVDFDSHSEGIVISQSYGGNKLTNEQFDKLVKFFKERSELVEPEKIRVAEQKDQIVQQRLNGLLRQRKIIDWISLLSPAYLFDKSTAVLMGTDLNYINRFLTATRQYRNSLIQYLYDKKAFSSSQFVYPDEQFSLADMPGFRFNEFENLADTLLRCIGDIAILLLLNILLFVAAMFLFLKYDPR